MNRRGIRERPTSLCTGQHRHLDCKPDNERGGRD